MRDLVHTSVSGWPDELLTELHDLFVASKRARPTESWRDAYASILEEVQLRKYTALREELGLLNAPLAATTRLNRWFRGLSDRDVAQVIRQMPDDPHAWSVLVSLWPRREADAQESVADLVSSTGAVLAPSDFSS